MAQFDVHYIRIGYCTGSGNGTRSLRAGDFVLASSSILTINFNHVSRYVNLLDFHWINIPIRSFYFLEIIGLSFYGLVNDWGSSYCCPPF